MNTAATVYRAFVFIIGCCFFVALCSNAARAQTRGKLEVVKDNRIDSLIARRYSPRKGAGSNSGNYSTFGYRIQIFSGTNRTEAFRAQQQFQELYPEIRTYISYKEPNFKVKAGDFRSRIEAAKLMQQLRSQFNSLFILSEKINPPLEPATHD